MFASGTKAVASDPVAVGFGSRFSLTRTTGYSFTKLTWATLVYQQTRWDELEETDIVTNHRFTASAAGWYAFKASASIINLNSPGSLLLRFTINGSVSVKLTTQGQSSSAEYDSHTITSIAGECYLDANDYVEVECYLACDVDEVLGEKCGTFQGHRFA